MPDAKAIPDDALAVVMRLLDATNAHDLPALTACFAADYVNQTPAHPLRSFTGREQVHANWSQLFASIRDLTATIVRHTVDASDSDVVWSQWQMNGTRPDGSDHEMAGVIVFTARDGEIVNGMFALEPVERRTGDVGDNIRRVTTGQPGQPGQPGREGRTAPEQATP